MSDYESDYHEERFARQRRVEELRAERENDTYKIIRFHRNSDHPYHRRTIKRGLTLEEAQAHCQREDTHGKDADGIVVWFDGYDKEN